MVTFGIHCLFTFSDVNDSLDVDVKVLDVTFEKDVSLRITENQWEKFYDLPLSYTGKDSNEAGYDVFSATIPCKTGVELAVRFVPGNQKIAHAHWDNNNHLNYSIDAQKIILSM